ncbi:TetR/AcrR family transcriptional regulator [Streptomyces minutiscleroticus]|uniref:HTH tetR-type domain-containing protein n=1 Tax=Streptomyces minutiscleroticus TaxID=68238 RepID=A0A918U7I9_9ACTN|nr:TetR/AcrR family transcriptional regulator [Streptomyces minutiscleroticus]GGY07569.1 hypothetical protein GCM10010358_70890 [Streptomyces minutiscleroticus]
MRQAAQDRTRKKRAALLDAAARIIAEQGYAQTTVDSILTKSGVGKGTFYHFFGTKAGIAKAIVLEGFTMEAARQWPDRPLLQCVIDAGTTLAVLTQKVPLVAAASRLGTEQGHEIYGVLWERYIEDVTEIMTECLKRGEVRPGVDPRRAATALVMAYTGIDLKCRKNNYATLPEEVSNMLADLMPAFAMPETMARLDTTVARARWLVEEDGVGGHYFATDEKGGAADRKTEAKAGHQASA